MNTTSNNTNKAKHLILAGLSGKRIIIIACALILIGYILMSGSSSTGQSFNPDIFSTRRIVIAPMLCLAGYLLMIPGILNSDSQAHHPCPSSLEEGSGCAVCLWAVLRDRMGCFEGQDGIV